MFECRVQPDDRDVAGFEGFEYPLRLGNRNRNGDGAQHLKSGHDDDSAAQARQQYRAIGIEPSVREQLGCVTEGAGHGYCCNLPGVLRVSLISLYCVPKAPLDYKGWIPKHRALAASSRDRACSPHPTRESSCNNLTSTEKSSRSMSISTCRCSGCCATYSI